MDLNHCKLCERVGKQLTERQHRLCEEDERFVETLERLYNKPKRFSEKPSKMNKTKPQGPPKPCGGCQKRKEWMNKKIPGSGDLVEKITTKTGIKDWWEKNH